MYRGARGCAPPSAAARPAGPPGRFARNRAAPAAGCRPAPGCRPSPAARGVYGGRVESWRHGNCLA
eukprot:9662110-Lingulodinium_polyedra.AAC.1